MLINFGKVQSSPNYDKVLELVLSDASLQKKFNKMLDVLQTRALAQEYGLLTADIGKIKRAILAKKESQKSDSLNFQAEKKANGYTYLDGSEKGVVLGALISDYAINGNSFKDRTVSILLDLINFDKSTISVAKLPENKDVTKINVEPVVNIVSTFLDKEITTRHEVKTQLDLNMEKPAASKKLSEVVAAISPEIAKMKTAEATVLVEKEEKNRTVAFPASFKYQEYDEDSAKELMYSHQKLSYPNNTGINTTADRHIHGLPISKQHRKYFNLATDVEIPEGIKKIHLFASDPTYATILNNQYDIPVAIVGKRTMVDESSFLSFITKKTASAELKKNKDEIMGIWVEPDDKTLPTSDEKAFFILESATHASQRFERYRHAFRYVNAFAMNADTKYGCCMYARKLLVAEGCCRGKKYVRKDIFGKIAAAMVHSYVFPFIYESLETYTKDYPTPLPKYSTTSVKLAKNQQIMQYLNGYMNSESCTAFLALISKPKEENKENIKEKENESDDTNESEQSSDESEEIESDNDESEEEDPPPKKKTSSNSTSSKSSKKITMKGKSKNKKEKVLKKQKKQVVVKTETNNTTDSGSTKSMVSLLNMPINNK